MSIVRRFIASTLAVCITGMGFMHGAQATVISTEQVAAAQPAAARGDGHARLIATLDRADVAAALQARGVDADAARERVASLTDAEADVLARQIDEAPAGADGLVGTIVFIFVLLLITDILGFTKVFPFTRSVR